MKLTKRGEYALRTLIRLGIAEQRGSGILSVATLAKSEKLPYKFLENILADLRRAGYVKSKRGKSGGVMLAKPVGNITLGEIVRLIDGRLAPIGCASETEYEKCTCPDESHCGLRMLMIDVRNAVANILDRFSLGDVVEVTISRETREPGKASGRKPAARTPRHADPADGFLAALLEIRSRNTAP